MKVLICGGRCFADWKNLCRVLDGMFKDTLPELIIHGAANGADYLAGQWAKARGIPVQEFPADWKRYKRAAGAIRNSQMLHEGQPDLVIAFPGGVGTKLMVRLATNAGVKTIEI